MNDLERYKKIEEGFYKSFVREFGKITNLYCIVGSLARDRIVGNWSDIDILIVVDTLNTRLIKHLHDQTIETKEKDSIKIGITLYTLSEFNSILLRDSKTHLYVDLINSGAYNPKIISQSINLSVLGKTQRDFVDYSEMSNRINKVRRALWNDDLSEKEVYKNMITILRIMLRLEGIISSQYIETLEKARDRFGFDVELDTPEILVNTEKGKEDLTQQCVSFLNWVGAVNHNH